MLLKNDLKQGSNRYTQRLCEVHGILAGDGEGGILLLHLQLFNWLDLNL